MAATAEAARLTEAHRLAQVRLGAATVQQLLAAWRLLDPTSLDATTPRWLRVAVPVVSSQHRASSVLASSYVTAYRRLEYGAGRFVPVLDDIADLRAVTSSLTVTGPVHMKLAAARGVTLDIAARTAATTAARAGMRHALAGGRGTISRSVAADPAALGWARAVSGDPCSFCAMLASRGPVYSEDTADFQAHDGCTCSSEPVYSADAAWPPGSQELRDLWDESTAGLSGDDARAAFREAVGK